MVLCFSVRLSFFDVSSALLQKLKIVLISLLQLWCWEILRLELHFLWGCFDMSFFCSGCWHVLSSRPTRMAIWAFGNDSLLHFILTCHAYFMLGVKFKGIRCSCVSKALFIHQRCCVRTYNEVEERCEGRERERKRNGRQLKSENDPELP